MLALAQVYPRNGNNFRFDPIRSNDGKSLPTGSVSTVVCRGTDKSKLNRIIATGMVRADLGMDTEGVSIYYNGSERKVRLSSLSFIRSLLTINGKCSLVDG